MYLWGCTPGFGSSGGSFYRGLLGDVGPHKRYTGGCVGYPYQGYDLGVRPWGPSEEYGQEHLPRPPNVPLLRALWSVSVGIWCVLECSWGVLVGVAFGDKAKDKRDMTLPSNHAMQALPGPPKGQIQ